MEATSPVPFVIRRIEIEKHDWMMAKIRYYLRFLRREMRIGESKQYVYHPLFEEIQRAIREQKLTRQIKTGT